MKPNSYPGTFVAFEGIEGSGKSTQVKLLHERLEREGIAAFSTKEPTDELFFGKLAHFIYMCESLREKLPAELERCLRHCYFEATKIMARETKRRHISSFEEIIKEIGEGDHQNLVHLMQLIITFDRHDHLQQMIIPKLIRGVSGITDRYFLSTPSYATANGAPWRPFLQMQFEVLGEEFLLPDLIIYLDIDPELGLARTQKKLGGKKEYFDSLERQIRIRRAYRELLAEPQIRENTNIEVLEGADAEARVHEKIWHALLPFMKNLPQENKLIAELL